MPFRDRAAGARQRRIKPRDFHSRTIRMTGDIAGLADLLPCFVESSRHGEFGETKSLGFQQLPRRTLVERAGDNDVGPDEQHILGSS